LNFVSAQKLVCDAQKRGYSVPALNTNGGAYDIARAAMEAAQQLQSPLILQVYEPNCTYRGFKHFVNLSKSLYEQLNITVPVALQLDHGKSFESVVCAMQAGFTSVMFDASHEPLEKNILKTRQVVKAAKNHSVSIEAEVGYVKGNEPKEEVQIGRVPIPAVPSTPPTKTSIEQAVRFVSEVDVDMLAVSVGTMHGVYQEQSEIDFELLKNLRTAITVPLVQHGTSGISLENLAMLSKSGMAKINFGEPFRYNYIKYFNELTDEMEHLWHPWKIMQEVKNRLKTDMSNIIEALGSDGKA